ncbi:hypothetical protein [Glutamicibacter sp. MCAF14]|uniref:hypothetical protein n=1 Tax=Glutamicibacter sp. MCAF14 TaxID=3233043 RepID=UPI003F923B64
MELEELRKIAEAVKQEPWVLAGGNEWISPIGITVDYDNGGVSPVEAEFIATFDPPTVLALLSRVEKAERSCRLLGKIIERDGKNLVELTNSQDIIAEDGDGDWEVVWERAQEMKGRLEQAERVCVKLRNRLDAMRRQRDGYQAQARKAEQAVARVRTELGYIPESFSARIYKALDGDTRG